MSDNNVLIMLRPLLAEFIGTALFVYIGCGGVLASQDGNLTAGQLPEATVVGIALTFGLAITTLVATFGHSSGGHLNPIVSIAMAILQRQTIMSAFLYIIAQLLGSIFGAICLLGSTPQNMLYKVTNKVDRSLINTGGAFLIEFILSYFLVKVIIETVVNQKSKAKEIAPLAIGFAVFLGHMVAIPYTGCSMNPARSFGPAVVSGVFHDLWLFIVACTLGSVVAAVTTRYINVFGSYTTEHPLTSNIGALKKKEKTDDEGGDAVGESEEAAVEP